MLANDPRRLEPAGAPRLSRRRIHTALASLLGIAEEYLREGYRYAVTAVAVPGASLHERGLSPKETGFYDELFAKGRERAGPAIRVWELPELEDRPLR